jgi:hypothetical protein
MLVTDRIIDKKRHQQIITIRKSNIEADAYIIFIAEFADGKFWANADSHKQSFRLAKFNNLPKTE